MDGGIKHSSSAKPHDTDSVTRSKRTRNGLGNHNREVSKLKPYGPIAGRHARGRHL